MARVFCAAAAEGFSAAAGGFSAAAGVLQAARTTMARRTWVFMGAHF